MLDIMKPTLSQLLNSDKALPKTFRKQEIREMVLTSNKNSYTKNDVQRIVEGIVTTETTTIIAPPSFSQSAKHGVILKPNSIKKGDIFSHCTSGAIGEKSKPRPFIVIKVYKRAGLVYAVPSTTTLDVHSSPIECTDRFANKVSFFCKDLHVIDINIVKENFIRKYEHIRQLNKFIKYLKEVVNKL